MNKPIKHVSEDGTIEYLLPDERRHREDGPAVIRPNGSEEYWINGFAHREDGPAIINANGTKHWFLNGKHHREDGPAMILYNGFAIWYYANQVHRTDGPAVIREDGSFEYWLNGKRYDPVTFLIKSYEQTS
jgi:hypothetical protein